MRNVPELCSVFCGNGEAPLVPRERPPTLLQVWPGRVCGANKVAVVPALLLGVCWVTHQGRLWIRAGHHCCDPTQAP